MKMYLLLCLSFFYFSFLHATNDKADHKIQVALLLDTSGSMDGLIEQAKGQLWKIVNELALSSKDGQRPEIEIALYQYGNDGISAEKGYIQQISQLTSDLDLISEKLFKLSTNGGKEFCGRVIQTSLDELEWSEKVDDLKLIFIAGNEEYSQGDVDYKSAAVNAIHKNVIVNTIFCGPEKKGIELLWKEGATLAEGRFLNLDHNEAVVHIDAPQDKRILKLNGQLNKTYVSYSKESKQKKEMAITQDINADSFGKANTVQRAVFKSSKAYTASNFDLIEAAESEPEILEEMEELELPEEFDGLDEKGVKELLNKKKAEREKIVKEINTLNKERTTFIAEKKKEDAEDSGLDAVMIKSIREQACSKNFEFE